VGAGLDGTAPSHTIYGVLKGTRIRSVSVPMHLTHEDLRSRNPILKEQHFESGWEALTSWEDRVCRVERAEE